MVWVPRHEWRCEKDQDRLGKEYIGRGNEAFESPSKPHPSIAYTLTNEKRAACRSIVPEKLTARTLE
jgi:hypothetical protein